MDVGAVVVGLERLDRRKLARAEGSLGRRLRNLGANPPADGRESRPFSGVVEYGSYADGLLRAEVRYHVRKDGARTRQKKLYSSETNDPEGEPARERAVGAGEPH